MLQSEAVQRLRAAIAFATRPALLYPASCMAPCVSSHLTQDQCPVPGAGQGQQVGGTLLGSKSRVWQVQAHNRGLQGERSALERLSHPRLAPPYVLMDKMRLFGLHTVRPPDSCITSPAAQCPIAQPSPPHPKPQTPNPSPVASSPLPGSKVLKITGHKTLGSPPAWYLLANQGAPLPENVRTDEVPNLVSPCTHTLVDKA